MSVRPYRDIDRRQSRKIRVGDVEVGGDAPISVQSMTNTLTTDVNATVAQIHRLEEAGADIVRVSCPDQESTAALKDIIKQVHVPIVADIHFHYKRAIEAAEAVRPAFGSIRAISDRPNVYAKSSKPPRITGVRCVSV